MVYFKLQKLYVDTYDHFYSNKNYFKSLEQFSMINHAVDDYLKCNQITSTTEQLFGHLKEKCQQNMSELNNYLYQDNHIVIDEDQNDYTEIEEEIEDVKEKDVIEWSSFLYYLFPCFKIKRFFGKEKGD